MKTKDIALCAVMTAVICICSVISVPVGAVPLSLGTLGVLLAGVLLGARRSAVSTAAFILLGAVGLPVFSSMTGGLGVLLGPTGGFIFAYVPAAILVGAAADSFCERKLSFAAVFAACVLGTLICCFFGAVYFAFITKTDILAAAAVCILPFLPFDIPKCAVAALLGLRLRKALTAHHV